MKTAKTDPGGSRSLNLTAAQLVCQLTGGNRIFDETAQSTEEVAAALEMSKWTAARKLKHFQKLGLLEQVWKHGDRAPIPAWRVIKKPSKPVPIRFLDCVAIHGCKSSAETIKPH